MVEQNDKPTNTQQNGARSTRSRWRRPVLHRMDAADAEMGLDPANVDLGSMMAIGGGS